MRCVVGIGSNLGDRADHVARAIEALRAVATVLDVSSLRETEPVGGPPQGAFLNAAALVSYEGAPHALLDALLAIEARLGRVREERWGPRVIDLDLLWIDGLVVDDAPRLVVPHPRLRERRFALEPLLEVAPDAIDPRDGRPLRDALA